MMRHKYQIDNKMFDFNNYKKSSEISIRDYNLQFEEIDANAYAYLIMMEQFGIELKFNGLDMDMKQKIRRRAEEIAKES